MNFTFRIYKKRKIIDVHKNVSRRQFIIELFVIEKKINEKTEYSTTVALSTNLACLRSESHSVVSDSLQPHGLACQAPLAVEFSRQEY